LARHGRAVARDAWHGAERDRPLTPIGYAQAAAAVPVLAAYGVRAVVASGWERCAATVAPYAHAAGVRPDHRDALAETRHSRSQRPVVAAVTELLAGGPPAVLCTHRPVLPTVLDVLRDHAGDADVAGRFPARDPYLEPGAILVAHVANGDGPPRVVAVESVVPPVA
jgi:8-oxo-(d)GTP phosphatase